MGADTSRHRSVCKSMSKSVKLCTLVKRINISVNQERDIGVLVESSVLKALVVLGQITRAFQYRDRFTFLKLCVQFVRCHLESGNPLAYRRHWDQLEKVQRRTVNFITSLKGVTYEDKLKELGILSLVDRRSRADLIQVFKILKGMDDVDSSSWSGTSKINQEHQLPWKSCSNQAKVWHQT